MLDIQIKNYYNKYEIEDHYGKTNQDSSKMIFNHFNSNKFKIRKITTSYDTKRIPIVFEEVFYFFLFF